jgi:hypothetical protein
MPSVKPAAPRKPAKAAPKKEITKVESPTEAAMRSGTLLDMLSDPNFAIVEHQLHGAFHRSLSSETGEVCVGFTVNRREVRSRLSEYRRHPPITTRQLATAVMTLFTPHSMSEERWLETAWADASLLATVAKLGGVTRLASVRILDATKPNPALAYERGDDAGAVASGLIAEPEVMVNAIASCLCTVADNANELQTLLACIAPDPVPA